MDIVVKNTLESNCLSSHLGNLGHLASLRVISSSVKRDRRNKKDYKRLGECQIQSEHSVNISYFF